MQILRCAELDTFYKCTALEADCNKSGKKITAQKHVDNNSTRTEL